MDIWSVDAAGLDEAHGRQLQSSTLPGEFDDSGTRVMTLGAGTFIVLLFAFFAVLICIVGTATPNPKYDSVVNCLRCKPRLCAFVQSHSIRGDNDGCICCINFSPSSAKDCRRNRSESAGWCLALLPLLDLLATYIHAQITQTFTIGTGFMVMWEILAILLAVSLFVFFEFGNYVQATPVQSG